MIKTALVFTSLALALVLTLPAVAHDDKQYRKALRQDAKERREIIRDASKDRRRFERERDKELRTYRKAERRAQKERAKAERRSLREYESDHRWRRRLSVAILVCRTTIMTRRADSRQNVTAL